MEFLQLAETLDEVSKTSKRNEKKALVAGFLRKLMQDEIEAATLFLAGRVFAERDDRTLNVSWGGILEVVKQMLDITGNEIQEHYDGDIGEAMKSLVESSGHSYQTSLVYEALTVLSVRDALERIASAKGTGSAREKRGLLLGLLSNASPLELRYLISLVLQDTRTGLSDGLLAEAIALAYGIPEPTVRRAWSYCGDLGQVAKIASHEGESGLERVSVELFRPVKPMLAAPADSVADVIDEAGEALAFELKLDGARVQIHKSGERIMIFSRRLNDVTESLPETVALVGESVLADRAILDGEVVAVDRDGTPYPFQVVMKRFGRTRDITEALSEVRVSLVLFDILLANDTLLVDEPYEHRRTTLTHTVQEEIVVKNLVTNSLEKAITFFDQSRKMGHEGLVAKRLSSPYVPGTRGKLWYKIKHVMDTLDLVITAAEWGHGRRSKWLSDYHLAVLHEQTGEFLEVGKTFKGLTDEEFADMTSKLLDIKMAESRGAVRVRPQVVVEVVASEVQKSPTYKSGLALRFARIKSIRFDKAAEDATTLSEIQAMYEKQFKYKAR